MQTDRSASEVAIEWIEKWAKDRVPGPGVGGSDSDLDFDIPRKDPRLCLDAILEVLDRIPADPSNRHFQVLAAGPLENLLCHNGEDFVDEVELHARRNPAFRLLLNGVWPSTIKPAVLAQLAKYRNTPW